MLKKLKLGPNKIKLNLKLLSIIFFDATKSIAKLTNENDAD